MTVAGHFYKADQYGNSQRFDFSTKVDSWEPLSVMSFPIPDGELPTGTGTIRFDRDVTDAA